jgi:hypothetical protein
MIVVLQAVELVLGRPSPNFFSTNTYPGPSALLELRALSPAWKALLVLLLERSKPMSEAVVGPVCLVGLTLGSVLPAPDGRRGDTTVTTITPGGGVPGVGGAFGGLALGISGSGSGGALEGPPTRAFPSLKRQAFTGCGGAFEGLPTTALAMTTVDFTGLVEAHETLLIKALMTMIARGGFGGTGRGFEALTIKALTTITTYMRCTTAGGASERLLTALFNMVFLMPGRDLVPMRRVPALRSTQPRPGLDRRLDAPTLAKTLKPLLAPPRGYGAVCVRGPGFRRITGSRDLWTMAEVRRLVVTFRGPLALPRQQMDGRGCKVGAVPVEPPRPDPMDKRQRAPSGGGKSLAKRIITGIIRASYSPCGGPSADRLLVKVSMQLLDPADK